MYLLKGGILGLIVFLVCSLGFVFVSQTRGATGVGMNLIKALTIQQGLFWAAMAGAILIGMWFVKVSA
jgi:hypothetical protein